MRKGWATLVITQGVDAWHVGLQPIVDRDSAAFVHLQPGCLHIERIGIGNPPRCHEQVRSAESTLPRWCLDRQMNGAVSSLLNAHRLCLKQYLGAVLA